MPNENKISPAAKVDAAGSVKVVSSKGGKVTLKEESTKIEFEKHDVAAKKMDDSDLSNKACGRACEDVKNKAPNENANADGTNDVLRALNATLRTKTVASTLVPVVLSLFVLSVILFVAAAYFTSYANPLEMAKDSAYDIVKQLRETPELAVLNVTVEKLAVYDSEHQNTRWDLASFLENKKEFCSIPVEISLQFGYDLSELSAQDVTIDDSDLANKSIEIRLPAPRILTSGYSLKYHLDNSQKKPICSSESGWIFKDTQQVKHGLKEAIRYQAFHEVIQEDWLPIFGKDVQRSTELFFTGILQNMGYKNVIIVTHQKG